ncbi:MAG: hypothetical protein WCF33_02085 [Pseudonocardiaceae bacterium]
MLLDVEGQQPRERGLIVQPAEAPAGTDPAQCFGERGTRVPGPVTVLKVGQQWMEDSWLSEYRKQLAVPRLGDRDLGRAPGGCQISGGD